ncbi:MAG TPA: DUF1961 family protein [Tichowtungia sp.]|nr:DUF1961 family protein [Tichowtungia sp.]
MINSKKPRKSAWLFHSVFCIGLLFSGVLTAEAGSSDPEMMDEYQKALALDWQTEMTDSGTDDWQEQWFLDGKKATIENTPEGMIYTAGPVNKENASHAVLWTKKEFEGNIKIEFDYMRLDDVFCNVNLLYIQATGIGQGPYDEDISKWSDLREEPAMGIYLRHMNLYHISYAAIREKNPPGKQHYVRARYYPVTLSDEHHGTDYKPDYWDPGVFLTGREYHVTAIKTEKYLFMHVTGDGEDKLFSWDHTRYPLITEGRVGIRHMAMRSSRYANVKVATSPSSK